MINTVEAPYGVNKRFTYLGAVCDKEGGKLFQWYSGKPYHGEFVLLKEKNKKPFCWHGYMIQPMWHSPVLTYANSVGFDTNIEAHRNVAGETIPLVWVEDFKEFITGTLWEERFGNAICVTRDRFMKTIGIENGKVAKHG